MACPSGISFAMLVKSDYVNCVDCRTAVAAFRDSTIWAVYSATKPSWSQVNVFLLYEGEGIELE